MARVLVGDKAGYIDRNGRLLFTLHSIVRLLDQSAALAYADREMLLDYQGFSECLASVQGLGGVGYIDKAGSFVIKPRFEYARPFSEGLALVGVNPAGDKCFGCKYGYINKRVTTSSSHSSMALQAIPIRRVTWTFPKGLPQCAWMEK